MTVGYRELLKRYILHLELNVGDNFIEEIPSGHEQFMSDRDLGELRSLAAEIYREATEPRADVPANYNHRFRQLINRHGLSMAEAAMLADRSERIVRRWRTSPRSDRYLPMTDIEFRRFEEALFDWLETPAASRDGQRD